MFVEKKTKFQIEQGEVENLIGGLKDVVTGNMAKCLRQVLCTQAITRIEPNPETIKKVNGVQYSEIRGAEYAWLDGVAFGDTDFIGIGVDRVSAAKCSCMYAGGTDEMVASVEYNSDKPISVFEESFTNHLSDELLPLFTIETTGALIIENGHDSYPKRLSNVELALDAIKDVYIFEIAFLINNVEIKLHLIATKSAVSRFGASGISNSVSLDEVVKRDVAVSIGAFYECERMEVDDILSLAVGDCIPLSETTVGKLKASLISGDVVLHPSGVVGMNSSGQVVFKCN